MSRLFFLAISAAGLTVAFAQPTPEAKPLRVWTGWGHSAPPAPSNAPAIPRAPAKFTAVPQSQTFSGKVTGLTSTQGVEIGVVSLVGVHWVNPKCYQWQPIAPDGTFSITSTAFPEAPKAIVVRGPEQPWTFLQADFPPGEGAKEIVLPAAPGRPVSLSMGPDAETRLPESTFQFFSPDRQFDNNGQALRRQQLGEMRTRQATSVEGWLPNEPIAVLVSNKGFASSYFVIDPRKADHFHFQLQRGGTLKVVVLDEAGNPRPGVTVQWANPAAPLSLVRATTDKLGTLQRADQPPGDLVVEAEGYFAQRLTLASGGEAEAVFRPAAKP